MENKSFPASSQPRSKRELLHLAGEQVELLEWELREGSRNGTGGTFLLALAYMILAAVLIGIVAVGTVLGDSWFVQQPQHHSVSKQ